MIAIDNENCRRNKWEFEYTASRLAAAAADQKAYRLSRVSWWVGQKAAVMKDVKETGIEVQESVANQSPNYTNTTTSYGPRVAVRADLQQKLSECHGKIIAHRQAAIEYDGWEQVLRANSEARLKLTHADWLYFFGRPAASDAP